MKTIILSAGIGNRLEEINKETPKCLIEMGGKTVLERQLESLNHCGIKTEDIHIVIGESGEVWNEKNKDKIRSMLKNVIINERNIELSSAYSLWLAIKDMHDNVLCLDGDLLFNKEIISKLINSQYDSVMLTRKGNSFERGNKVLIKKDRILGIGPDILSDRIYVGISKFGEGFLENFKKECITNEYFNTTLDVIIYKLCHNNFVYNVDLDDNLDEDWIFLNGGSHAITKEIILPKSESLNGEGDRIIRKEATEGKEKLINEVRWILNLPEDLLEHFPKIIRYDLKSDPVYVEMEKYQMKTLRKLLMGGEIASKEALEILKNVFDFMFANIYSKNMKPPKNDWVKNIYFKRVEDRFEEIKKKTKIFKEVIDGEEIFINGKKFLNVKPSLEKIKKNKELVGILTPKLIRLVHGDLHFDNILVDKKDLSKFILIDPRGKMYDGNTEGDYAYDLGKIWHSLNGLYDFLHEGKFYLKTTINNKKIYADFRLIEDDSLKEYKKIFFNIPNLLYTYEIIKKDPYWDIRVKFNEVIHFCSMMPFHVKGDGEEKLALALYLRGVMLLNAFLEELEFRSAKSRVINLNTPKDYFEAKRLFEVNGKE